MMKKKKRKLGQDSIDRCHQEMHVLLLDRVLGSEEEDFLQDMKEMKLENEKNGAVLTLIVLFHLYYHLLEKCYYLFC